MSRSYKRTPIFQDGYGTKSLQWYKRQANKKVRRSAHIKSGKAYRKVYDTWIFRDYFFRKTLNQYRFEVERELKHYLNIYGSIDATPGWIKKQYKDRHYKIWKRIYYWK